MNVTTERTVQIAVADSDRKALREEIERAFNSNLTPLMFRDTRFPYLQRIYRELA